MHVELLSQDAAHLEYLFCTDVAKFNFVKMCRDLKGSTIGQFMSIVAPPTSSDWATRLSVSIYQRSGYAW